MIPRRITGATIKFGPPQGWDEAKNGLCGNLMARCDGATISTAWEPTPEELAILNKGGSVVLTIWGGQPPVMLTVEPQ